MNGYKIPFNKPYLAGKELYYIAQAVITGRTAGDGDFTRKCQNLMEKKFNAKRILLTTSCTTALEMAAILCDIKPGDEVIIPSFTFVSTANAFYLRGAKLIFVDIEKNTLNINTDHIQSHLTDKTRVIVPVHYAGIGCNMDLIVDIAFHHNLLVVEDSAQGVNAKYKNKYLGTIGDIGTYSFHETKNYICGEGGAIVLNNDRFIERAEIIREKGTNRSKFFRGEVDKYTWVDIGSSFLPSDILAAFLFAQLENMEKINKRREEIFNFYYKALIPLVNDGKLRLPYVSSECESNSHLFYIILQDGNTRNALMDYLKSKGILAVFHYLPLHLSKVGQSMGYKEGQFPITESMSERLLRLPFYYDLKNEEQDEIVGHIKMFLS
jgi:dTDP-4-amino-4,6-dideoxygalactose transaminase